MKTKYVLKNKKRFFTILIAILTLSMLVAFAGAAHAEKQEQYTVITVMEGDTLWDIASDYNDNGDIREFIHRIKEINKMDTSQIYQGTELKIPVL